MSTVIFTDGGHRMLPGKGKTLYSGYGVYVKYDDGSTVKIASPLPLGSTNNIAELEAIIEAFEIIIRENLKDVTIASDSMYCILGITSHMHGWVKRGWLKGDGNPPENLSIWKRMYDLAKAAAPLKFTFQHVKAHTDKQDTLSLGNALVDELATAGVRLSGSGKPKVITTTAKDGTTSGDTIEVNDAPETVEASRVKKPTLKPMSGLTDGKRLYVAAQLGYETPKELAYHMCTFEDKRKPTKGKKKKKPSRNEIIDMGFLNSKYLGRANAGDYYGIYFTDTPVDVFEQVIKRQSEELPAGAIIPACVFTDRITPTAARTALRDQYDPDDEEKSKFLWANQRHIYMDETVQVTHLMEPALMSRFAEGYFRTLSTLASNYKAGTLKNINARVIDITDIFYKTLPVGGLVAHKSLGNSTRAVTATLEVSNRTIDVVLTLGSDCPGAMAMGRLPKQYSSVKVELVIMEESPRTFKVAIVINADDDMLVCYSPHSSLRIL